MRVKDDIRDQTRLCEGHFGGRDYLTDYTLAALTGGELIALLQIADYLHFHTDSSMVLFILELNDILDKSGFVVGIQQTGDLGSGALGLLFLSD